MLVLHVIDSHYRRSVLTVIIALLPKFCNVLLTQSTSNKVLQASSRRLLWAGGSRCRCHAVFNRGD